MTKRHYDEVRYPSADNRLELFARDYPVSPSIKAGCPLLMMHGLTRNSADFEPLIHALAPERRMIVADQRGRGKSQYDPSLESYRPDVYVEDMWKLMDRLELEKFICVGTSMGGLMSMLMGSQKPERIAGIVLNDIGPLVNEEGLDRIRSYVGGGDPMKDWEAAAHRCGEINQDAFDGFWAEDWRAFADRTCEETADGHVRFAYDPAIALGMAAEDTTAVPPDLWPVWDSLSALPLLVIRGAKSDLLSAETVAEMHRRHPDDFTSVEIPGRGHAPLLDEPEAVSAIRAFLDEYG